jgi:conjugative relaxase-like TrwC/TraI family protein
VGQERYYERQVAQGLDDYFTGRGESPGRWLGRGARDLGLQGTVEDGELSILMDGRDPRTGTALREQPVKVAALDLTFSAPKSVSVLHAVADERVAAELVACHEEAVEAALAYLEETAVLVTRRTGDQLNLHEGGGFVTAAFRHRMSRALDPQLHTHCVSANMAKGKDGRWTALHHPTLYRAAQTAGYLYQAHLRALVRERLALEWGPVTKGAAELEPVPRVVLEEFSKRRHEMRRAAADGGIGLGSRSSSQAAALATRSRKQYGVETGSWREEVRARAAEHGLDRSELEQIERDGLAALERGEPGPGSLLDDRAERVIGDRLAGATGLTELQNTFDQRAVLRALAEDARQGERIGVLRERGGRFVQRRDVLRTEGGEFTTAELVAVERRLVAAAHGRASEGAGRIDEQVVSRAITECGRWLNQGQRRAVEATVSSGHGVQVIEALAGTGKTYTAGVLRHVYEAGGYQVAGVAPTGRAVRELAEEAGIASRTLAALIASLERGYTLPPGGVVVLDEAGMAPTRQTALLLEAARDAGCKVIAIGDPGQLHSVEAGGWMRAVGRKVGTLRLSEVMRQRDPSERRALAALHDGKPQRWLSWAQEQDLIAVGRSGELVDRAVSDWHAAIAERGLAGVVLIARDNDTRRALNDRARTLVRERRGLGEERDYGPVQVAVGDRVICRQNDRLVDVDNGTRGTVRAVDDVGVSIQTDGGTVRRLPASYVVEHVEHAYALTGHGMQGGTVERAFVVAFPHELTRGWSYTALSRARDQTRLFVMTDSEERDRDELAPGERQGDPTETGIYARLRRYMQTRDDEDLAIEQLPAPPPTVELDRDAGRDLERAVAVNELQEAGAVRGEPAVRVPASIDAFRAAAERVVTLHARLEALATPEIRRLEAAERRERELIAHREELHQRTREIPPSPKLPLARDRFARERENLRLALDGVDAELRGVGILRARLVGEVGEPDQIRAERRGLESLVARARTERDAFMNELVARELATPPTWAIAALGERPAAARERQLWDRATRGLARYRLEHDVTDERVPLGDAPTDPVRVERHEQARDRLERVRHELGIREPERERAEPLRLPSEYARLFGAQRAALLEDALTVAEQQMSGLTDEQLRGLAATASARVAEFDRQAAAQAIRLEHEHAHHRETAANQADRAARLEEQADRLGWRARREREQLRDDAELHRQHAARHVADAERIELELQRMHATGRHPEQWLHDHREQLVKHLAAGLNLVLRGWFGYFTAFYPTSGFAVHSPAAAHACWTCVISRGVGVDP